jgi:hypothetical protein
MKINHHKKCLLLNADFTPIYIISWKKALIWQIKYANNINYGIDILDFYKDDFIVGTHNKKYPVAAIAKTKQFLKSRESSIMFSRKNIFLRDNHTCQYCNSYLDTKYLTYDHVIPKSKWNYDNGSPTTWTNITTSCIKCNLKKGNRTPKEANMPLISLPIKPNKTSKYLPISHQLRRIVEDIPDEWKVYLPNSYFN